MEASSGSQSKVPRRARKPCVWVVLVCQEGKLTLADLGLGRPPGLVSEAVLTLPAPLRSLSR